MDLRALSLHGSLATASKTEDKWAHDTLSILEKLLHTRILCIWVCLGECSQHESIVKTGHPLPYGRMSGYVPWSLQGMQTVLPHNASCPHPQTLQTDFESKLNFKRKCHYDAFKPFFKIQRKAMAYSWMHEKKKKKTKELLEVTH